MREYVCVWGGGGGGRGGERERKTSLESFKHNMHEALPPLEN